MGRAGDMDLLGQEAWRLVVSAPCKSDLQPLEPPSARNVPARFPGSSPPNRRCLPAPLPPSLLGRPSSSLPVLRPSSHAYAWWALLMLLLDLSYTAVLCPVSVAFSPRASLISWVSAPTMSEP